VRSSITSKNSRRGFGSGPSANSRKNFRNIGTTRHSRPLLITCGQTPHRWLYSTGPAGITTITPQSPSANRHSINSPSTTGYAVQQADSCSANSFHRPYYYCCSQSINFLLEEDPWGNPAHKRQPAAAERCRDPRRFAFKFGRDALRLVIGRLFSNAVGGVTKGPYRRGDHAG
jgi:hypothetical protein